MGEQLRGDSEPQVLLIILTLHIPRVRAWHLSASAPILLCLQHTVTRDKTRNALPPIQRQHIGRLAVRR
jgi:hypothetical protein